MRDHLVNANDYLTMCRDQLQLALGESTPIEFIIVLDMIRGLARTQSAMQETLDAIKMAQVSI
jgi:hypothetical protein